MTVISLAAVTGILLVNLTGIALLAHRAAPNYALAKVTSPVLASLALFFVEHFVGLGALAWLRPLTTLVSLLAIWRWRSVLRANWAVELVFATAFAYALLCGFCSPNLDANSEKLTDLTFISNYLGGATLPPPDRWLPPYRFDIYYGFQFYSAALLGRILHLDAGLAYRLGFCTITALTAVAAGAAAYFAGGKRPGSLVSPAAFLFGGTGASLLAPYMIRPSRLFHGLRFIGESAVPANVTTAFGAWLLNISQVPALKPMKLPAETFGYLVPLGDFHPPMGGFLLLMLALLSIALIESESEFRASPVILAATIPILAATNAWNLPLQGLLVGGWVGWRLLRRARVPWISLAAGAGGGLLLVCPFLVSFSRHALGYGVHLRPVPFAEHTPPLLWTIVFAPYLLLLAAALWSARHHAAFCWWSCFWAVLLALTEFFYADDVYVNEYNRFNSTLKWWPWIMAGMLITLGPLVVDSSRRFTRWAGTAALVLVMGFAGPIASGLINGTKDHGMRLDGAGWLTSDTAQNSILDFLRRQPPGIVLQRLVADSFTPAPGLVIHAGQTAFLGWPGHERLWRGPLPAIQARTDDVKAFYLGQKSAAWLLENKIDHVLWLASEASLPSGTFEKVSAQISSAYSWRLFSTENGPRAGVWSRTVPSVAEQPPR